MQELNKEFALRVLESALVTDREYVTGSSDLVLLLGSKHGYLFGTQASEVIGTRLGFS